MPHLKQRKLTFYIVPLNETHKFSYSHLHFRPGAVVRSEASSLGMQAAPEFDPHVRHILLWRPGHENISTAILPLPLIQEEQLSVTGERMCTKYW